MTGLSGFAAAELALTRLRAPSAHSSGAATPGLTPPGCDLARTTGEPQICLMPARTCPGTDSQSTRTPSAGGAVIPRQPAGCPGGGAREFAAVALGPGNGDFAAAQPAAALICPASSRARAVADAAPARSPAASRSPARFDHA